MAKARHYTRLDTSVCPDQAECASRYHLQLFEGDCCECCGVTIEDEVPVIDDATNQQGHR